MPIYEFRCGDCAKKFELIVLGAGSKKACPKCGGKKLERLVSRFATASKGGSDDFGGDADFGAGDLGDEGGYGGDSGEGGEGDSLAGLEGGGWGGGDAGGPGGGEDGFDAGEDD